MRSVDPSVITALEGQSIKARDFIWITAHDFTTRVPYSLGFWNDVGVVTAPYIDVNTGSTLTRDYIGSGTLVTIDPIPLTNDVTVRTINVQVSQIDSSVAAIARGYDLRGASIEIHRGLFHVSSTRLVYPAVPRFVGFIDTCQIIDPTEGQVGQITLGIVSHTRELTRVNGSVRSNADQQLRVSSDTLFQYVGVVPQWPIFWGANKGKIINN